MEESVHKPPSAGPGPEADSLALSLTEIIDSQVLQSLLESLYDVVPLAIAVLDVSGKVLVAVGWQDICTRFHRVHPCTAANCLESDTCLTEGVPEGTAKAYRCKNQMWDAVSPIWVGTRHVGNIFLGQFFYEEEPPDEEGFRAQARLYGFDEAEYLAALARVPRCKRETADALLRFCGKLAGVVSSLSFSATEQARSLEGRRRAEAALRDSEENLRVLFDSFNESIIIYDVEGRVLEVNETMLQTYGVTRENCRDFSIADYSAPVENAKPASERFRGHWEQLQRVNHLVFEWRGRRPLRPEEEFDTEVSLRKVRWYDQDAVVAVIRDISERKRLESMFQQSQKLEALGQLAGGVAHDTNNMLGVIIGCADLVLESSPTDGGLRKDLEQIRKAAFHSAALTRQLLAFARKQTIQPQVADLNALVGGTQQMLRRLIGEQHTLRWKPASELWPVWVDPSQVDQILANLVVNARDALGGGGSITLETAKVTADEAYTKFHPNMATGDYVVLTVTDTGHGMSPEVQARVFEPFFTTKEAGRGTGLGLATVYGIVRQSEGFINVYSAPGAGTTFRIHLPRYLGPESPREAPAGSRPRGGSETILLVEDEEPLLEIGRRILESAGYRVLATSRPLMALKLAQERETEIALLATDLVMPHLNGYELFESILSIRPDILALFLSGYPAGTISLESLPGRGAGFLQKPFTRAGLLGKVREVLDSVHPQPEP